MKEYSLYSEFDIRKHKNKFVNYLEILIEKNGHVVYAVPSHQEKALSLAAQELGISKQETISKCPPEFYGDFLAWLLKQSGAIAVWDDFFLGEFSSIHQYAKLRELKLNGLYKGKLPKIP